ncbi:MAG TPA: D-alanyl-D-alanine carboxypeptidase/D-alanyl-D-alanine-endopeptidase [Pyrinomonadaceae bacterium]|nr:D-alanyl-D-alanine carboxypeptidase/D-alanyl-D-alanine-endopeptidase [Pyrinomonadaceae bacterium]HMP65221.1 D-alanyl-D-alanine carboxypeptidase/D-alanyl-D-alanine-endopeptidase [Pyrinomonadaceae bacterium]
MRTQLFRLFLFTVSMVSILAATYPLSIAAQTRPARTVSSVPASNKQTLGELSASIQQALERAEFRRAQIGFKVVSLASGTTIFDQNSEKYMMPASNMKNFTVAAALDRLGADYRIVTSIYAAGPVENGVVHGPVRIFGRGDISISYTFNNGNYFAGIDKVADAIIAAGVKRIEGDIIGDETYFRGSPLPTGWEWDDLQWYYGAEVSALPINDNVVNLSVTPGPAGYPCLARMSPANLVVRVVNDCKTVAAGNARTLKIEKKLDRNLIEISGELPVGNQGFSGFVSVSRPAEMFVSVLKQRLEEKGVVVAGRAFPINTKSHIPQGLDTEIAKLESPPLSEIAARTMKPSQNMYTETLLWTLGEEERKRIDSPTVGPSATPHPAQRSSAELGIGLVKNFLMSAGVPEDGIIQYDGSGLSRHNLITPSAVVHLYTYMAKQSKHSQAWRDSLTIGGVDGTLRNRFRGTPGEANVRGKTGTINQVSALSGYITTAGGEQLVFSAVVNGVQETRMRVELIDEIVLMLANYNGTVDQ